MDICAKPLHLLLETKLRELRESGEPFSRSEIAIQELAATAKRLWQLSRNLTPNEKEKHTKLLRERLINTLGEDCKEKIQKIEFFQ